MKRKRYVRLVALALAFVMLAGDALPARASGDMLEGETGVEDSVFGVEQIGDFKVEDGIIVEYTGDGQNIVIPDGITGIADQVFANISEYDNTLVIPDSVTEISETAFENSMFSYIEIGKGITSLSWISKMNTYQIYQVIFWEADVLTKEMLNSVTLKNSSFDVFVREEDKDHYQSVRTGTKWPEATAYIYDDTYLITIYGDLIAYYGNDEKVVLPENITGVTYDVFAGMKDLKEVVFPEGLTWLADGAFGTESNVETLTFKGKALPDGILWAFIGISDSLQTISLENASARGYANAMQIACDYEKNTGKKLTIECNNFEADENGLYIVEEEGTTFLLKAESDKASLTVPDSVTHIAVGAFTKCKNLKSVVLPENIKGVGEGLFEGTGITEIQFKGVTIPRIWDLDYVFSDSYIQEYNLMLKGTELEKITVPEEVLNAYKKAFTNYKDIIVSDGSGKETVEFVWDEEGLLLQYAGNGGKVVIPEGVKRIPNSMFREDNTITSVEFPETLTTIENYAFYGCENLGGNLEFPDSVTSIGEYAFSKTAIKALKLGAGITLVNKATFYGCTRLEGEIKIPDRVSVIAQSAFEGCSKIEMVYWGNGLKYLNPRAFMDCTSLTTLVGGNIAATYRNSAMAYCKNLSTYIFKSEETPIIQDDADAFSCLFNVASGTRDIFVYAPASALAAYKEKIDKVNGCNVTYGDYLEFAATDIVMKNAADGIKVSFDNPYKIELAKCQIIENDHVVAEATGNVTECIVSGGNLNNTYYLKVQDTYGNTYMYKTPIEPVEGTEGEDEEVDVEGPELEAGAVKGEYSSSKMQISFSQSLDTDADHYVISRVDGENKIEIATLQHDAGETGKVLICTDSGAVFGESNKYIIEAWDKNGNCKEYTFKFQAYNYLSPNISVITNLDMPDIPESPDSPDGPDALPGGSSDQCYVGGVYNTLRASVTYSDHGDIRAKEIEYAKFSYTGLNGKLYEVDAKSISFDSGVNLTVALDLETLEADTELTLTIKDTSGKTYTKTQQLIFINEQPAEVEGFYAYSNETEAYLSWIENPEITTTGYHIYRKTGDGEFELLHRCAGRDTLSYTDKKVVEGTTYTYYITAVSFMGVESAPSLMMEVVLQEDKEAPKVTMNPEDKTTFGKNVKITVSARDNVKVDTVRLYMMEDEKIVTLKKEVGDSLIYTYTATESGEVTFWAEALDINNLSTIVSKTYYIDLEGPEKVVNLTADTTATTAVINWDDVKDNDFSYFLLEQFDKKAQIYKEIKRINNYRGVELTGLTPETEYTYRVTAYDIYGNKGNASDELMICTKADTTEPVITSISPAAGYHKNDFTVKFVAQDDVAVTEMTVQYSENGANWKNLKTFTYTDGAKKQSCEYEVKASEYEDGTFQMRAIAKDAAGNISIQNATAPCTEYGFDREAPAVPENVNIALENGYIHLTWKDNVEADRSGYNVYRAIENENEYQKIASDIKYMNYVDYSVDPEKTYYYKVSVLDKCGNESDMCTPVSISLPKDEKAPVIYSIHPADSAKILSENSAVSIKAGDNHQLSKMTVEYATGEEVTDEDYTVLCEETINTSEKLLSVTLPDGLSHGDEIHIRAIAEDMNGNRSEMKKVSYIVDADAPEVSEVTYTVDGLDVTLNWTCDAEDTNGFYIYRKSGSSSYSRIGSVAAREDGTYTFKDESISESMKAYTYQVKALDQTGNSASAYTSQIPIMEEIPDYPVPALECTTSMQVGTEYIFDATGSSTTDGALTYEMDFGDGTKKTGSYLVHKYDQTGDFVVTLTVTNERGFSETLTCEVKVHEKRSTGTIKIKVTDENGKNLPDIPVYFDMDNTTKNVQSTGADGIATFHATAGIYKAGAYQSGYLPEQCQVIVTAGNTREVTMVLEEEEIVTGTFEVNRMTLSEIQAAGIDPADPANQNIIKTNVILAYGTQEVKVSCFSNSNGDVIDSKPVIVDTNSGKRELIVRSIYNKKSGDSENLPGTSGQQAKAPEAVAVLDIPVGASSLKEFFDVKLHIINNASSEFHLINNVVSLNVPEGMTLMDSAKSEAATVRFNTLTGQDQKTITWILRGDKEGEYELSADYSALLKEFDADVAATFVTENPIKVYGKSNMELVIRANDKLLHNTVYFEIGLRNKGTTDLLYPSVDIAEELVLAIAMTGLKDKECEVELLEEYISNNKGYSQVVNEAPKSLAAGEMYSKKYAVYGAGSDADAAELLNVVVGEAEKLDYQVTVEKLDMELYNPEDAKEKVDSMLNGENQNAYQYLKDNKNFCYYVMYQYKEEDWTDEVYDFSQVIFAGNFDAITKKDQKEIIKKMIAELIADSSTQQIVQEKVDTAYLDTTKKVLDRVKDMNQILDMDAQDDIDGMLSNAKAVDALTQELKLKGASADFFEAVITIAGTYGYGKLQSSLKSNPNEFEKVFVSAVGEEFDNQLSEVSDIIGTISGVIKDWNSAAESVNILMNMQYSYAESIQVLTDLLDSEDEVIREVAQEQLEKLEQHRVSMAEEYIEVWTNKVVDKSIGGAKDLLIKKFKNSAATKVYGWACIIYKIEDSIFGWSKTYNAEEKSAIAGKLTDVFLDKMQEASSDTEKLHYLRYVIELRLIGERTFIELLTRACEKDGMSEEDITKETISWYDNQVARIVKYRDDIFKTKAKQPEIPAAPVVTVNTEKLCTNEKFDSNYEYSFDNDIWISCNGNEISFIPKEYSTRLYVRVKGTGQNLAGEICMVSLPALKKLDKDARVLRYNGVYSVKGLSSGQTYLYRFAENDVWLKATASADGILLLQEGAGDSVILRKFIADEAFVAEEKELNVQDVQDVAAPAADKNTGSVSYGTTVKLECHTDNAIIYYTTDGTNPTHESRIWDNDTSLEVTKALTVKAFASIPEDELYHDSAVVTFIWTPVKLSQTVTSAKSSYTCTYGQTAFSLGAKAKTTLSYVTSNSKVAKVSSTGKVTLVGAGTAKITIKAAETAKYKSASRVVTITVKAAAQTITGPKSSYTYTYVKNKTFSVKASAKNAVTYKTSNKNVATVSSGGKVTLKGYGTAKITITAKSSTKYKTATKTVKVTVKPVKMKLKSVTAGTKKLTVKWTKDSKAAGYQLQYSTSSKFTTATTKSAVLNKTVTSKVVSNLKAKKTYYVRIRAYTTVGGTKVYGNWSNVISRKTK